MLFRLLILWWVSANVWGFAQIPYNFVKDVRVSGISVGNMKVEETYGSFQQLIPKSNFKEQLYLNGCAAGRVDVAREYPGAATMFRFEQEALGKTYVQPITTTPDEEDVQWMPSVSKEQLNQIKGSIWIVRLDKASSVLRSGGLTLDGFKVDSNLTFADFKKRFPKTAQQEPQEEGISDYFLFYYIKPTPEAEPNLDPSIRLRFKNGLLEEVEINRADDC